MVNKKHPSCMRDRCFCSFEGFGLFCGALRGRFCGGFICCGRFSGRFAFSRRAVAGAGNGEVYFNGCPRSKIIRIDNHGGVFAEIACDSTLGIVCILGEIADEVIIDVGTHFFAVIRRRIDLRGHLDRLAVYADFLDLDTHIREKLGAVDDFDRSKINAAAFVIAVRIAGNIKLCAFCSGVDADGVVAVAVDMCDTGVICQQFVLAAPILHIPLAVRDCENRIA